MSGAFDIVKTWQQKADLPPRGLPALPTELDLGKLDDDVPSSVIDTAIAATPTVSGSSGSPHNGRPHVAELRKLIRKLEFVVLMVSVYEFVHFQALYFQDLDQASEEGYLQLRHLRHRSNKVRESLISIFTNLGNDEAVRFVRELKSQAPKEFWDGLRR